MNRIYFVRGEGKERRFDATELPLRVGGAGRADIALPGLPADAIVALIAESEGHAFIQPVDGALALFHNHERLLDSAWLKSGDQVQVDDGQMLWQVQGDQVIITATRRQAEGETELRPPAMPPRQPLPVHEPPETDAGVAGATRRRWVRIASGVFALLAVVAAFILFATPVAVEVDPQPEEQTIRGFPPPVPFLGKLLALPGSYTVTATRAGYYPLKERIKVEGGAFRQHRFSLQPLPGRLIVQVDPDVPFRLFSGEDEVSPGADHLFELPRGTYELRVQAERYLPENREVEIAGFGQEQVLSLALKPAWADVWIATEPAGAEVQVDDEAVGITPLKVEIVAGWRTILLTLAGHNPVTVRQEFVAGTPLRLDNIVLPPADAQLVVRSRPAGATVSIDGDYQGTAPVTVTLTPNTEHQLQLGRAGHQAVQRTVTLAPGEEQELEIRLEPEYGFVFLATRPADASLRIDGKPSGDASRRLSLTTRRHTLEIYKPGYVTEKITLTPRAGVSQSLDVVLKTERQAQEEGTPATVTTAVGQLLKLIRPGEPFSMGASRREAGRRANESQRKVQLTRPFYIGEKEVTNGEYRQFKPGHRSGTVDGAPLDGDSQPVVNVSWDDAARYCNWLSGRDGLPAAYKEQAGKMVAISPMTTGYRLPTEAEWAYVARVAGRKQPARYPWAGKYPPSAPAGNFADARIADALAHVVPDYDDNYRGTAPVGTFPAGANGLHDLGGNVAEWVQDYYAVYPGEAQRLVRDPTGPVTGDHHVVRGSSWRQGSITELRLSYRDYSRTPRSDLGFRLARYAIAP